MADPPATSTASGRRPLFRHPWRVAIVVGTLLVVLNLGFVALNESDTTPVGPNLPARVTDVTPAPNSIVGLIDDVSATLQSGYSGSLVIDGVQIPDDQLDRVVGLNQISFRPGPGKEIGRFRAGDNTAVVEYWEGRPQDRPEKPPYSFGWRFRAAA
jgi:hypothetical protein